MFTKEDNETYNLEEGQRITNKFEKLFAGAMIGTIYGKISEWYYEISEMHTKE